MNTQKVKNIDGKVGEGVKFERIRRITGYLVGTIDRFNDAKAKEVRERVKHGIGRYDPYHIWTKKHVSSYLHNPQAYLWILRVYELETPQYLSRTNGIRYANVDKKIELTYAKPVISDKEFEEIKEKLL